MQNTNYHCPICGLKQIEPPWGPDNKTPSFNICPCCGVEFGYEDNQLKAIHHYRNEWLNKGTPWFEPREMPREWEKEEQMKNIPKEFF